MFNHKCNHKINSVSGQTFTLNYTGEDINDAIKKMKDLNIGEFNGYMFAGVADPTTIPMEHTYYDIYYLATIPGTYPNFNNIEIDGTKVAMFISHDDGIWKLLLLDIPLDTRDVAENAKLIADLALANTTKVKEDVEVAKNTASAAMEAATNAISQASAAAGLANSCIKKSDRGIPNGVPILDSTGKVPQSLLPLTKTELVDSYEADDLDKAPTAAALHRLYMYHEEDIITTKDLLNAVLDMVSDSTALGVSPSTINVSSLAQDVKVQVICNGEWSITGVPDTVVVTPIRGNGSGTFNIHFNANDSTTDNVTGSFKVSNAFGSEKLINFTQYSASVRYEYNLSVIPTTIALDAYSGSGSVEIVSTKTPYINNDPLGEPEPVAYVLSTPAADTWFTVDNTEENSYKYTENILEASRSSKLIIKQEGSAGLTKEIPVTQSKASVSTEYLFTITPDKASISDNGAGGTYPAKIVSTKTVTVNDVVTTTDVPYQVSYTGGASNLWVAYDKSKHTITLPLNNEETSRSGSVVFTLESPLASAITVNIEQQPASIDWKYTFEYTPTEVVFGNAAGSKQYSVTKSVKQKTINGTPTGEEIYVDWAVSLVDTTGAFTLNSETSTITATENIGETRTAILRFSRAELGEAGNKDITITQSAGVVTWTYTLEANANPTSIAALNGSTILTVTSTKQKYMNGIAEGSPVNVSWHATSTNGYLSGEDLSGAKWTMTENRTESTRTDILTIAQLENDGKTKTLTFTLLAGTVTYDYVFTVSPESLNYSNSGSAQSVNITSTKLKKINGINSGALLNVAYKSTISGEGYSISGVSISIGQNNTEAVRNGSVTFTLDESNTAKTVVLSQAAGTVDWVYTFAVNPTSLSYAWQGSTQYVTVNSSKLKRINGNNVGSAITVEYTASAAGSVSVSSTAITMSLNNTLSVRSGSVVYTQSEGSGKSSTINCNQSAGVEGWNYYFSVSPGSMSFPALGNALNASVSSYRKQTINGSETGTTVDVGYTSSADGGFAASGASISIGENTSTSTRGGTAYFSLNESSGKSGTISLSQVAGTVTTSYNITCTPTYRKWKYNQSGSSTGASVNVVSELITYINGKYSNAIPVAFSKRNINSGMTEFVIDSNSSTSFNIYPRNYNSSIDPKVGILEFYVESSPTTTALFEGEQEGNPNGG